MSAIRFERVFKSYDGEPVLEDLSFEVREGEAKVVLGGGGSGKTTLLKLVLGLVKPDSGRIYVHDQEITGLSETKLMPIRKKIGMVFQESALFDSMTVGENVGYRLLEEGKSDVDEVEGVVRRLLSFVGLEPAIDKMPSELSGGMKRRVAIARAMVGEPRILLYDEPTAGLDPITSRTICDLVIKLRDLEGVASIFVTHDLKSALTLSGELASQNSNGEVVFQPRDDDFCLINTRFVILKDGQILFEGYDEAMLHSEDPYIQEFLT